ncbi:MAG TPA: hypothetical protein GXX17_01540 [Clostridiales bacterium]|nr:hypothetical protein [Clostridiales bacterium]
MRNPRTGLLDKYIFISAGLVGFSAVLCVVMAFTGAAEDIPFVMGVMGLASFALLFFLSLAYKKSPEDQQRLDKDFFLSLVNLSEEDPKQFYKEFKRLLGHGTRYIILLFVLIFLSIEGIIAIGIEAQVSVGGFGIFVAGLFGVLFTIIKSLYIKYPPVEGYELTAENAPEILETIERARLKNKRAET